MEILQNKRIRRDRKFFVTNLHETLVDDKDFLRNLCKYNIIILHNKRIYADITK